MGILFISYDLNSPGQYYDRVKRVIETAPTRYHVQKSAWLIKTNQNAKYWGERIRAVVDENDTLIVTQFGPDVYGWMDRRAWEWTNKAA